MREFYEAIRLLQAPGLILAAVVIILQHRQICNLTDQVGNNTRVVEKLATLINVFVTSGRGQ